MIEAAKRLAEKLHSSLPAPERCATLTMKACSSEPSSAHLAKTLRRRQRGCWVYISSRLQGADVRLAVAEVGCGHAGEVREGSPCISRLARRGKVGDSVAAPDLGLKVIVEFSPGGRARGNTLRGKKVVDDMDIRRFWTHIHGPAAAGKAIMVDPHC